MDAERLVAQRVLTSMVRSSRGRASIVACCRTYILNKAGELSPDFMPSMAQLQHIEGELSDTIEKLVAGGVQLDMTRLNGMCDRMAEVLVNNEENNGRGKPS
jgi:hypothetical protein